MVEKDFFHAYSYFSTAVEIDSNRTDLLYKLGDAAREFHSYSEAERWYQKVLDRYLR